jgi:hypothetical protein
MNEEAALQSVHQYFLGLGYPASRIGREVSAPEGFKFDLVIYNNEENPLIVVEAKAPTDSAFPNVHNITELRFHPYVRKLQTGAAAVDAKYYVLSNGDMHFWFETASTGRPELLHGFLRWEQVSGTPDGQVSEPLLVRVLANVKNELAQSSTSALEEVLAVLLLARLEATRGNRYLESRILSHWRDHNDVLHDNVQLYHNDFLRYIERDLPNGRDLYKAYQSLESVPLGTAHPSLLLRAVDQVLFTRQPRNGIGRIDRILADFLIKLAQLPSNAFVADINCGSGEILAGAALQAPSRTNLRLYGVTTNPRDRFWTMFQQVLAGRPDTPVVVERAIPYNLLEKNEASRPTHVVTAPTFGTSREPHFGPWRLGHFGVRNTEDLYLELATNWVAPGGRVVFVAPESMLFSQTRRQITRRMLLESAQVRAIISLPPRSFNATSGLKISVIVADKRPARDAYRVFLGQVKAFKRQDSINSLSDNSLSQIIRAFQLGEGLGHSDELVATASISSSELDADNLTVQRYLPAVQKRLPSSVYPLAQLGTIARKISRGSKVRLDPSASSLVIGPGAIRAMELTLEGNDATGTLLSSAREIRVETGDIVINGIGSHIGEAATITDEYAGALVSQHVYVVKPDSSRVLTEYLAAALNSDYVRAQIEASASGTLIAGLRLGALEALEVPLPPLAVQKKLVARLDRARRRLDKARADFEMAEMAFTALVKALGQGSHTS